MISSFETEVKKLFKELKKSKSPLVLEIRSPEEKVVAHLELITEDKRNDKDLIKLLAQWREKYSWYFPSQFRVTLPGTSVWLQKGVLEKEDRILFMIKNLKGEYIGHIGLYSFDFTKRTCEIDNVVRGKKEIPGLMTFALESLIKWTFDNVKIDELYLKVFKDNKKAIELYKRCNFVEKDIIPLYKRVDKDTTYWEVEKNGSKRPSRYFLKMEWRR